MDEQRYQETLSGCCLVKDLKMMLFGDHTQIGERGVTLSGGQKQHIQLALLDDPFSVVEFCGLFGLPLFLCLYHGAAHNRILRLEGTDLFIDHFQALNGPPVFWKNRMTPEPYHQPRSDRPV
ncbi:hypothetical protein C2845_PM15G02980 [Panicum miliaceum]|uniref:ABC transporter domain-containing protein n=1 Tax=Panicum miliaceum TaxID=4540 RepID=A0A3L6QD83_PANMI|nr:hypothetical protein C2845_PM15G02980 [Panicum miliaceum]